MACTCRQLDRSAAGPPRDSPAYVIASPLFGDDSATISNLLRRLRCSDFRQASITCVQPLINPLLDSEMPLSAENVLVVYTGNLNPVTPSDNEAFQQQTVLPCPLIL
jgi:hypothetical protein